MAMDWKKAVKPASAFPEFQKTTSNKQKSAQEVVAAAIDKQIDLFKHPRTEGRRWFETKGDNVAFTVRYANRPLKLVGDETTVAVPKAQFSEVMESIKADVENGAFKDQLAELEAGVKKRTESMRKTRAENKKK